MSDLWLDFETRSRCDLKVAGARRYSLDPTTQITTAVWEFRGRVKTYCSVFPALGDNTLAELYADVRECSRFVAHNVGFDVNVLLGQNPFAELPLHKIDCTMARAQARALPGGLDDLCAALGVKGKDPRGGQLVMKTCKPQRDGTFCEDEKTFRELLEYNIEDVAALKRVDALLSPLSADEREIWERTWRKNELGLPIDVQLATAIAMRRQAIEIESAKTLAEITGGAVEKLSQRARLVKWCNEFPRCGDLPSTKKHEVAETLANPDLHPDVRIVLELLQAEGGSAPLKAQALLNRHTGGRYKDGTRYFGARSGRGTSEGANMFNIARPSGRHADIEPVIQAVKAGEARDNTDLTDCLRGCITAPDGWMIADNDLSNAEYRIAMWMAGDEDRLAMLAANGDPYMHNAVLMGWVPPGSTKKSHPKERQDAKPVTLGGNYQLGWRTYQAHEKRAGRLLSDAKAQGDIQAYRSANPLLQALWHALDDAFRFAIYEPPGRRFPAGKVFFEKDQNGTVWMNLPSGRAIPHYRAHVMHGGQMAFFRAKFGAMRLQKCFGGSLLEIACQSITRDVVTQAEKRIEAKVPECRLILDVYDSILALVPAARAAELSEKIRTIMKEPLTWSAGLPIDCEGYEAPRMRK